MDFSISFLYKLHEIGVIPTALMVVVERISLLKDVRRAPGSQSIMQMEHSETSYGKKANSEWT